MYKLLKQLSEYSNIIILGLCKQYKKSNILNTDLGSKHTATPAPHHSHLILDYFLANGKMPCKKKSVLYFL